MSAPRIVIADIRPEPTREERIAIERALEVVWPSPATSWSPTAAEAAWRLGSRRWRPPVIPAERWGRP